ncbi:alpha/beta-hydrolase [Apiospora saccharicola]|uniref:Alpha/beta-hydrolase n=1 Tax=Apiospora saccharicola TaxID=335842 RepID=A0ABR1WCZ0_9PEZI
MTENKKDEVEFKTLDGLTLRGTLYLSSESRGPAVIMTPGVAQYLQEAGISALVYDPRTVGASEGLPRNHIVPALQISDYSDALTYLKHLPSSSSSSSSSSSIIDPDRIAFWGFSFSGAMALCAAALDKRACAVVAVCPLTAWELDERKWRGVMAKCMQDRESQTRGGNAPFALPMVDGSGQNPAGFGGAGVGARELALLRESQDKIPSFEITTTIQTYWHLMSWGGPFGSLKWLEGMPVLVVTPEDDCISPARKQKELIFDAIPDRKGQGRGGGGGGGGGGVLGEKPTKTFHLVHARGHMDVLDGDSFQEVMGEQVRFLRTWFGS